MVNATLKDATVRVLPIYKAAMCSWTATLADAVCEAAHAITSQATAVNDAVQNASTKTSATSADVSQAVTASITTLDTKMRTLLQTSLKPDASETDAKNAAKDVATKAKTLQDYVQSVATAARAAAKIADPSLPLQLTADPSTDPLKAIDPTGLTPAQEFFTEDATGLIATTNTDPQTTDACRQAAVAAAQRFKAKPDDPTAAKSRSSDRFMELQFSFTSNDMESSSSQSALSSQTDWHANFFFGSAAGSHADNSSKVSNKSFETNMEIKIGLKAAKVDISRGWFDPGVFKLTQNMSRLSNAPVSYGPLDYWNSDDWKNKSNEIRAKDLSNANSAIMPCFPVAFVVAKDVTIQFQVSQSALSAVQQVLDSRSATGGGFLCFNASSSTASHTDASSLNTKTQGTVVTINMPGPQILGWFLEFTPKDNSDPMTTYEPVDKHSYLNIIKFAEALKRPLPAPTQPS